MSLPNNFPTPSAYFVAAVDFLASHSWVYREPNTRALQVLDTMPQDFKDYFLHLSNEHLNLFPFVHEKLSIPSETVRLFRQQLAALTPEPISAVSYNVTGKRRHKMAAKKQYEIDQLAAHIHYHRRHSEDTELLVDLGAGLGYLSEALYELNPNYLILGLEADEQRVAAATERCRQFLPQTAATKSINYKQAYIGKESCELLERHAEELLAANSQMPANQLSMAIIGLHACADLSINAISLFLALPRVRRLHIMPCCYHKLELVSPSCGGFINFPLSATLRGVLAAKPETHALHFNRPFMRLACQQTSARWRDCGVEEHSRHGQQMFYRALAEAVCDIDGEIIKQRSRTSPKDKGMSQPLTFKVLKETYQLCSKQTGCPLPWRAVHEERFAANIASHERGACLAESLTCLQTSMQKLCENLVLYDRLCYLEEAAAAQHLRIAARYEKLLDEKISPRCFVLVAEKFS